MCRAWRSTPPAAGQVDLKTMTIIVGVVVTLYTMLGGIQAVIWNDVIQFCIMFGGLAATVLIVWSQRAGRLHRDLVGGAAAPEARSVAAARSIRRRRRSSPGRELLSAADERRHAAGVAGGRPHGAIHERPGHGAAPADDAIGAGRAAGLRGQRRRRCAVDDRLVVRRLRAVRVFSAHALPPEFATDKLVPYFMSLAFPAGAVGLVIAAIMAASLSSIDSAINSCRSVAVVDLYNRLWRAATCATTTRSTPSDREQVRGSRIATRVLRRARHDPGLQRVAHRIAARDQRKVVNAFTGPLFGIFLLAMFSRRASSAAVLVARRGRRADAYYVAYHSGIGFMWPSTFGLVATLVGRRVLAAADAAALRRCGGADSRGAR